MPSSTLSWASAPGTLHYSDHFKWLTGKSAQSVLSANLNSTGQVQRHATEYGKNDTNSHREFSVQNILHNLQQHSIFHVHYIADPDHMRMFDIAKPHNRVKVTSQKQDQYGLTSSSAGLAYCTCRSCKDSWLTATKYQLSNRNHKTRYEQ